MTPKTSLDARLLAQALDHLSEANALFMRAYPGDGGRRQPVHTVYGGAHLFKADSASKLGAVALRALEDYAPEYVTFARAVGLPDADRLPTLPERFAAERAKGEVAAAARRGSPGWLAATVHARVLDKLHREPVEDFRIDFEDGYGNRPDDEEDRHAAQAAEEVAAGLAAGTLPPFIGIRVKPFSEELRSRSIRTLDMFLTALVGRTGARLPANFVVTLPKVVAPEQVTALANLLELLEPALGLARDALRLEAMIETPQAILSPTGESNLPKLAAAARGRMAAAHFGTYDYTASCDITAAHQHMTHPACDFAKHMMKVAFAGTGIWLSDGATNIMPVAPHKPGPGGALSDDQIEENRASVQRAWKLHYEHIQHSLENGYYQGWDLHPAQLPTRYAAVYAFFLRGLDAAAARLRNFLSKAGQATLAGDVFDDAATGQGLLNYFLRAVNCGALTEAEAADITGLSASDLRRRSFLHILKSRPTSRG